MNPYVCLLVGQSVGWSVSLFFNLLKRLGSFTFNDPIGAPNVLGAVISIGMMVPILLTLSCSLAWSSMALIGILTPVISIVLIYFIPESPAWLVTRVIIKDCTYLFFS